MALLWTHEAHVQSLEDFITTLRECMRLVLVGELADFSTLDGYGRPDDILNMEGAALIRALVADMSPSAQLIHVSLKPLIVVEYPNDAAGNTQIGFDGLPWATVGDLASQQSMALVGGFCDTRREQFFASRKAGTYLRYVSDARRAAAMQLLSYAHVTNQQQVAREEEAADDAVEPTNDAVELLRVLATADRRAWFQAGQAYAKASVTGTRRREAVNELCKLGWAEAKPAGQRVRELRATDAGREYLKAIG